jgi:anti-anti-sigma regulatory factor
MNIYKEEQGILTCILDTKLDTIACQKLEWDLEMRTTEHHNNIIFDLVNTEYISSSFIRICIKMVQLIGRERFSLLHVNPNVMQVLIMANLTGIVGKE